MSAEIIESKKDETSVDVQKRAFMSKFGKYAAAGAGMAVLMTPISSSANCYRASKYSGNYNWPKLTKRKRHAVKKVLKAIRTDRRFNQSDRVAMKRLLHSIDRKKAWKSLNPSQQTKARQWLKGHPDVKQFLLANR